MSLASILPQLELSDYDCSKLQRSLGNVVWKYIKTDKDTDMGEVSHRFDHIIAPDDTRSNSANKLHDSSIEHVQPGIAMQSKTPLREARSFP